MSDNFKVYDSIMAAFKANDSATMETDRFIPIKKLAHDLGKTTETIRNWQKRGEIKPAHKIDPPSPNSSTGYSERYLCRHFAEEHGKSIGIMGVDPESGKVIYDKNYSLEKEVALSREFDKHPYGPNNVASVADPNMLINIKETAYYMSNTAKTINEWTKKGIFPPADKNSMRKIYIVMMVIRGEDWREAVAAEAKGKDTDFPVKYSAMDMELYSEGTLIEG